MTSAAGARKRRKTLYEEKEGKKKKKGDNYDLHLFFRPQVVLGSALNEYNLYHIF